MNCCDTSVFIGCFNYCSEISTGFIAQQDGEHFVVVYVVNQTAYQFALDLLVGEEIVIPAGELNEAKLHEVKIIQPDGQYFEFEPDVICMTLRTQIII